MYVHELKPNFCNKKIHLTESENPIRAKNDDFQSKLSHKLGNMNCHTIKVIQSELIQSIILDLIKQFNIYKSKAP